MTENKYISTKEICTRFRCSSRTIFRKMKRPERENPFPYPRIKQAGSQNLWCSKEVGIWEDKEIERTALDRFLNVQEAISAQKQTDNDPIIH